MPLAAVQSARAISSATGEHIADLFATIAGPELARREREAIKQRVEASCEG